jgi:hypothetical protein
MTEYETLRNLYLALVEKFEADSEAVRHELEAVWEAINELQGIDPAKVGEPDGNG